jgi:hypothetical protein
MAITGSVCIELIKGHKVTPKRGLAWLIIDPPDKHITAKLVFEKLKNKQQIDLRNRFDMWLAGQKFDKYFHGWPNEPNYKDCFVFKLQKLRLFGFLCKPKPDFPDFQLCVLVSHSTKDGWDADVAEKNRMNALKDGPKVIVALKHITDDCSKEKQ